MRVVPRAMSSSVPVCFVVSHAQLGGAEVYLGSLLTALGRPWIDRVILLAEGPFADRLRDAGLEPRIVPCGRRAGLLAGALRLRRALRDRPVLIHANGVKAALVSVLATKGKGIPVIWHKHDLARDGAVTRWVARRCDLVIGVSAAALAAIEGRGVRTAVIPNGVQIPPVDRAEARERLVRELAVPASDELLCVVGRLHPGKGQLEALEVLPQLLVAERGIRLILAGAADPYEPQYERVLRSRATDLGVEDRVAFLGHREDAIEVIAGCDLLVAPSVPDSVSGWREGFGLAPLEALAVGTPVAGYSEGGLTETLGDCAALVRTGDREGLAEAIAGLLDDAAKRERLSDCGRKRARRFELSEAVRRMRSAYQSVMGMTG
jgi:glycosyltransferase involved in cell wall biosynthesis